MVLPLSPTVGNHFVSTILCYFILRTKTVKNASSFIKRLVITLIEYASFRYLIAFILLWKLNEKVLLVRPDMNVGGVARYLKSGWQSLNSFQTCDA